MSVRITGLAPSALPTAAAIRPIGPAPVTTRLCPATSPPRTSRPYIAVPAVTINVATSSLSLLGHANQRVDVVDGVLREAAVGRKSVRAVTLVEFAVVASVVEAGGVHPLAAALAAAAPGMDFDGDALADGKLVDVGPRATIVPMYSWPGVKFLLNGGSPPMSAGGPWQITSRSVAQMAVASMRTSTSATPGLGTGLSIKRQLAGIAQDPGLHRSGIRNPASGMTSTPADSELERSSWLLDRRQSYRRGNCEKPLQFPRFGALGGRCPVTILAGCTILWRLHWEYPKPHRNRG